MAVIAAGFSLVCTDFQSNGGVKKLYFLNSADVDTATPPTIANHIMSAITLLADKIWYVIAPEDFTVKADFDVTAKGKMSAVKTKLEFVLPKYSATNLAFANKLKEACGLIVAIEFGNGSKVLYGYDEKNTIQAAMYLANSKGEGGAKTEDSQMITLALEGEQTQVPLGWSFTPDITP